jgi:4-hydroxy-3-polyprenylbenzoate decarboxylase
VAYNDLREWIAALEKAGELKRIKEPVSPRLEITEITDRVSKAGSGSRTVKGAKGYAPGGPALLFENIIGHPGHRVFINQFGSERRMAMSLGVENLEQIAGRIHGLMNLKAPEGLLDKFKMLPQIGGAGKDVSEDGFGEGCAMQAGDSAGELQSAWISRADLLAA